MSGLTKPDEYAWKDSNMELFGSSVDRQVKKESAMTEKCWEPVGKATQPFLMVWRVNKFKLEVVPKDEIGNFYNGDSYVVCKATKSPDGNKLLYNVHFWIGRHSTADEYGTAAYKTVELDTYLDDAAIQHREVEGYESDLFKSYFDKLVILKGGYESGFRQVKPEEYRPRLLHFCKEGRITYMRQVTFSKNSVNSGDVFILDLGSRAYQFNGSTSSAFERSAAAAFLQDLESKRNGRCSTSVLEESLTPKDHEFWTSLPDTPSEVDEPPKDIIKSLYRVSYDSGKMELTVVSEGKAAKSDIKSDDVYMILSKQGLFVYIGKDCSPVEKRNALSNAHNFLKSSSTPFLPITVVTDEQAESFLRGVWDE
uniref:Severin n=2 Tax=Mesocestoides corti TaxID=53468 RepID=A0A5K3EYL4_MESCO